jgi:hypothetical protein
MRNVERVRDVDGYWYIATPYTKYPDGLDVAANHAEFVGGELVRHGVKAYSPIAYCHKIAKRVGLNPTDINIWIPFHEPMISASYGLIVAKMLTWEISTGVSEEIKIYEKAGKPIEYLDVEYDGWGCLDVVGIV